MRKNFFGDLKKWQRVWVDFEGNAISPTGEEPAKILISDSSLRLQVTHDPKFRSKCPRWVEGLAAADRYNNAFLIGAQGFAPTKEEGIVIETNMQISKDFHGSTGIWMEEQDTFDEKGIMKKPFRSFGFSFLGDVSDPYIKGLAIETSLGFSIQKKISLPDIDVTQPHDYKMVWRWKNKRKQKVDFYIDKKLVGSFTMAPIGPGEIQLWADNYWIRKGMRIDFLNPPEGCIDENKYSHLKVYSVPAPEV